MGNRQRSLQVLDLEYLGRGPWCAGQWLAHQVEECRCVAGWHEDDLRVGAASHYVMRRVMFDLPRDLRKLPAGGGPDAADARLLEDVDPEWVAERFDRVVIGSGDHIFTEMAIDLRERGLRTCAVGYEDNMARRLRLAVDEVRYLGGEAGLAA